MFLSGKAGSGKSHVIKNVLAFIRIFEINAIYHLTVIL